MKIYVRYVSRKYSFTDEKSEFDLIISIAMQNDQCNFFQREHL